MVVLVEACAGRIHLERLLKVLLGRAATLWLRYALLLYFSVSTPS